MRRPEQPTRTAAMAVITVLAGLVGSLWPVSGATQSTASPGEVRTGENPEAQKLEGVRFEQNLEDSIPFDLEFQNEEGETVPLAQYFGGDLPVVMVLGYFECPMLCGIVRRSLVDTLAEIDLELGRDYEVLVVSIDPDEGPDLARAKTESFVDRYRDKGGTAPREVAASGVHTLTGGSEAIDQLADTIGFHYRYDDQKEEYLHPSGFAIAAPDGTIARYFFGVTYEPSDLRLGLVDASRGQIGSPIDQVLLRCYQYDPQTGSYSFAIMQALRIAAIVTTLLLALSIWLMFRTNGRLDDEPPSFEQAADSSRADEEET